MNSSETRTAAPISILGRLIFFSRWLQAPLYIGLIATQCIYVYKFITALWHLVASVTGLDGHGGNDVDETVVMMAVLELIDIVMIANLLVMVIVGGYETFVSRLRLHNHPDQPEWLSHVNAGVLKVKLATALIGISSIHLLQTFISLGTHKAPGSGHGQVDLVSAPTQSDVILQIALHMTFVFSALLLAFTDRLTTKSAIEQKQQHA